MLYAVCTVAQPLCAGYAQIALRSALAASCLMLLTLSAKMAANFGVPESPATPGITDQEGKPIFLCSCTRHHCPVSHRGQFVWTLYASLHLENN